MKLRKSSMFGLFLCSIVISGSCLAATVSSQKTESTGGQLEENETGSTAVGYDPLEQDSRLAIEGYDPVAYFTMLTATRGQDSITYDWLNKKWYFISEEHKAMFAADPMHYLPNSGGF